MSDSSFNKNNNRSALPAIRAYLGGSFNPVHNSHVQMAMQVYHSLLPLAEQQQRELQVSLLPNARSPFKQKVVAPKQRLAMLKLAIQNTPLQISELELWQTPPVYSIDTVRTLQQHYPNDSLIFIMGMDSLRSLDQWRKGLQITNYVHLWVFDRSDSTDQLPSDHSLEADIVDTQVPTGLKRQMTDNPADLAQPIATLSPAKQSLNQQLLNQQSLIEQLKCAPLKSSAQGRIYIDPYPITTISSTFIRNQLFEQLQSTRLTPTSCHSPIDFLVKSLNPAVYHYIIAHQLYSAAQFR